MARAVGIDLGTTQSAVAVWESGRPRIIAGIEGYRTTPSVVAYGEDGQRRAGQMAHSQALLNPSSTIRSAKRFLGCRWGEVDEESFPMSCEVARGHGDRVEFVVRGTRVSPEEVLAQVLSKLLQDASMCLGEPVDEAVVTTPACFNDAQRRAIMNAGEIAGLKVLRLINDPTAAALAFSFEKRASRTILVFDLGGGALDVSILDVGEGVCEVRASCGEPRLGGDDFDRRIVDWAADEFLKSNGIDIRSEGQTLQRLREAAERAKCELSSVLETQIDLPFIVVDPAGPKHLATRFTRARFDDLTHDLVQRCVGPVRQVMADAGLTPRDLDEVILVGGSTRIPAVQETVKGLTGGKMPNLTVNRDEVVAMGAAIQAAILKGEVEAVVLLDALSFSLGSETVGGLSNRLMGRNTTIPARREEVFSTTEDGQTAVEIVVLQGEQDAARVNRVLGRLRVEGIRPAQPGVPQIRVTFDVDANGLLSVAARDQETGSELQATFLDTPNLAREEVGLMVKKAREYDAQDRSRRETAEARNEVDSRGYRLERLLKDLAQKVPLHEKTRCEELVERARRALREEKLNAEQYRLLSNEMEQALQSFAAST